MATAMSHPTWTDVTIDEDTIHHEQNGRHPLEKQADVTKEHIHSPECTKPTHVEYGSCSETHVTHRATPDTKRASDDVYCVNDDTSALVPRERDTSRRRCTSHETKDVPRGDAVANELEEHRVSSDYGSHLNSCHHDDATPHHCHAGHDITIDLRARNQLIIVSVLCFFFMIAEIVGGVLSNSLALITDATHMASDLTSFLVSLLAMFLATKAPTKYMTLGYHRAEVVGALVSVLIIWVVTAVLVYLAIHRILHDSYTIHADQMIIVAAIGVVFNIVMGIVLHRKCNLPTSFGHNHSHGGHSHGSHSHGSHSHGNHSHGNHSHGSHSHGSHSHGNHDDNHNSHVHSNTAHENSQFPSSNNTSPYSINADIDQSTTGYNVDPELLMHVPPSAPHHNTVHIDVVDDNNRDRKPAHNINIRAAMIHVIGDFIQSIGVLIAAIVIKVKPEYKLADPICTFLFSALVLFTTFTVLRDIMLVLLEAKPRDADYECIMSDLGHVTGVKSVHSLALWSLTVSKTAAIVHLAVEPDADWGRVLRAASHILRAKHDVYTSTVQVEPYTRDMHECKICTA